MTEANQKRTALDRAATNVEITISAWYVSRQRILELIGPNATDQDIIVALMRCFDRPAFLTPFHSESSLPRFKLALAETIDALNTGRLPSGVMIPSRHTIQAVPTKAKLAGLVELVVGLRASFDQLVREKQIRPCGCSSPTCDIFMLEPPAARLMDGKRQAILDLVRDIDPSSSIRFPSSSIRFYGSQ